MNMQKLETLPPPPGVIGSLKTGFDAVSTHVGLILLPLILDVFLWFGPRFSVSNLLVPFFKFMFSQTQNGLLSASDLQRFVVVQNSFLDSLQSFNLLSLLGKLRIFPVGISSLLAQTMPVANPLGKQSVVNISSLPAMIGLVLLLTILGWVCGGLYFRWVSETTLGTNDAKISLPRAILQSLILSLIWFVCLTMIMLPVLFVLGILALINPTLASGAIFVFLLMSFWVIVPLFFTPHGIFVRGQNALYSILSSLRMSRFTLPTSGLFVFLVFFLSTGLNFLWSVPPEDSWMMLVGIAGHAFITTTLVSASFVYYRDMNVWLQNVFEQLQPKRSVPTQQA